MEKFLVSTSHFEQKQKPLRRLPRWKRCAAELDGRVFSKLRHQTAGPLVQSFSEVTEYPHYYKTDDEVCATHDARMLSNEIGRPIRRECVSGMEFDSKGVYLASVTKFGCLTIHDFETLYCLSKDPSRKGAETENLLHLDTGEQLDVVRWNPADQNKVACGSLRSDLVLLFDIGYMSTDAVELLKPKRSFNTYGQLANAGVIDIAFTPTQKSRVLASNQHGIINVWDRRFGVRPCLELRGHSQTAINSLQLNLDDQIIYGANKHGFLYAWDLRGGRKSGAFQSANEVYCPPIMAIKLASELEKIASLKAQSNIVPREIHSISLDPSCSYQLAFHLDNGWSGIFNTHSLQVTHVHCPPPTWLKDDDLSRSIEHIRKPTWLPTCSIYAVGTVDGIYLLDFYPDSTSACHVNFMEDLQSNSEEKKQRLHNRFIPLAKDVIVCAAHPMNGTIIAGTGQSSLLMISQMQKSCRDCDESG